MVELFEYALQHHINIEIRPVSKLHKLYELRVWRGNHSFTHNLTLETKDPEGVAQHVLDACVRGLNILEESKV